MAIIRNTFSTTFNSITAPKSYTITGLTSDTSSTSVTNMVSEISLYFLRSLYQTLLDAGYNDASINETDYSITVLGFKFFVLTRSTSTTPSTYKFHPYVYVHGYNSTISITATNDYSSLNVEASLKLDFNITVRGDKNFIWISYSGARFPNVEYSLFVIAKGKNLINSETNYLFSQNLYNEKVRIRNASELYTCITYTNMSSSMLGNTTYYTDNGYNTSSKTVVQPLLYNYGTCIYPSLIIPNGYFNVSDAGGKYYKIGNDIYFYSFNVYKTPSSSSGGASLPCHALFKVS